MPTRTAASQIRSGSVTLSYVRFGSKADMAACQRDVRFTPESGHSQCKNNVRLVPIADISQTSLDHGVSN